MMLITKTNVFSGLTPTISIGASADDAANLTKPSFSLNYTSVSKSNMSIDFGSTGEINYVAVAGLNIAGNGNGASRVRLLDGAEVVATTFLKRNHCVVLNFDDRVFSDLKIDLLNATQDKEISLAYVSGGLTLTVPNGGEHAGYSRQWLTRGIKSKVTTNALAAPVSALRKPIALKGSLSLPDMTKLFSEDEYQDFLDFAINDLFFIQEDETLGESSYCCFELTPVAPKAHSQTRSLNNLSFNFKVFNGL